MVCEVGFDCSYIYHLTGKEVVMASSERPFSGGNTNFGSITIRNFLEHYLGMYCNPHGVVMTIYRDDTISVASTFYRTVAGGMNTVGVAYDSESMNQFLETFAITSIHDLDEITALSLMALYQQGRAEIYCCLDNHDGLLCFRRQNECLYAKDDFDVEHAVPIALETAEAFVRYTKQYFEEEK